ncbi:hypothetical protein JTE90_022163 [Oedothorax gibbosus]|uniref:Amiloride-sensitive sodium channel n=1 Tax=Oedothorax gibbosus TaxID=931172 RepID=A0AAV6VSQ6_9ARAC|nr:hypothetical protein JTE90_022163 [Oedothorax gibbosus]
MDIRMKREPEDFTPDVKAAIKSLNLDPKIEDLLTKLKLAHTSDVRDAEKYFHPTIRVVDDYGIPYDSMILSCSYGPEPCSDMVTLYSPDYGKCYMFNYVGIHNSKDTPVKKARQAGRHHGLQLYMQSRKEDTIPLLTRELGVRIVVHDPRSIPLASENGIDIRPGDMVSVNVEYTEIHRLGEPWGQCVKDGDVLPNNYSTVPYSQADCERYCIQKEIFRRCHCYHIRFLEASVVPKRTVICANSSEEGKK